MGGSKFQIEIIGIFPTEEYQRSKYYADYLYKHLPNIFKTPKYRPMFDVQWTEFLTKYRRLHGLPFWKLDSPVAVFLNGKLFGDEKEFTKYCNVNYGFHAFENFDLIGKEKLLNLVRTSERNFVYFTISINDEVIGTLLFKLFNDLVPLTCKNFMELLNKNNRGYKNSPIHRVVKSAWIQVGGYHLKGNKIPCENYFVPHDQRGIISMCNSGKHRDNNMQFFISLQKSHWMDYYYVAFGQLLHGEDILQKIEAVPTKYESPLVPIIIEDCGEYTFDRQPDKKFIQEFEHYIGIDDAERMQFKHYPDDIADFRDVDSCTYSEKRFNQGLYSVDVAPESEVEIIQAAPVVSAATSMSYLV